MPVIKVNPSGETFEYEAGPTLLELLLSQKYFMDNPCNGKGVCGKGRVKIVSGNVEAPTATEMKLLSDAELKTGIRLSCLIKPTEDLEVELLQKERKHEVLTSGYVPEFEFDTDIKKINLSLDSQVKAIRVPGFLIGPLRMLTKAGRAKAAAEKQVAAIKAQNEKVMYDAIVATAQDAIGQRPEDTASKDGMMSLRPEELATTIKTELGVIEPAKVEEPVAEEAPVVEEIIEEGFDDEEEMVFDDIDFDELDEEITLIKEAIGGLL